MASRFIGLVDNMHKGLQASLGVRSFHQFLDHRDAGEDHALTSTGDMGEEAMFDGLYLEQ